MVLRVEKVETGARWRLIEQAFRQPTHVLESVGGYFKKEFFSAFKQQGRPAGSWPPRMVPNVPGIIADYHRGRSRPPGRRFDARPALIDENNLHRSIDFEVVSDTEVAIGTNKPYAATHQFGEETESEDITAGFQEWLYAWLKTKDGRPWRKQLGWLLNKKYTDTRLTITVRERPFITVVPGDRVRLLALLRHGFSMREIEVHG